MAPTGDSAAPAAPGDPAATSAAQDSAPGHPDRQLAAFEALLGVQVTLYDFVEFFRIDNRRLLPDHHGAHDRCGFCRYVKDDLGRMHTCLRCDMEPIVLRAQHPARWRRCHAGVWEVICPLWDGATFIGAMNVGCFRRPGEDPAPLEEPPARRAPLPSRLKQEHRALRQLDAATDTHLPDLVTAFAQGLVREVARLRGSGQPAAAQQDARHRRHRAINLFFRTHHAADAQLSDLADYLHLSPARTSQILRQELHTTFPALIRDIRLAEARRLLAVSDLPVGKIAELAGFSDRNYFCRVFTRELKLTPSEYRKQNARTLRA